jgi:hypothetical protein
MLGGPRGNARCKEELEKEFVPRSTLKQVNNGTIEWLPLSSNEVSRGRGCRTAAPLAQQSIGQGLASESRSAAVFRVPDDVLTDSLLIEVS